MATRTETGGGWTAVATYNDLAAAHIAAGMLQAQGIPAQLTNATLAGVYPMTDTWAAIEMLVPASLAETARRLLKQAGDE